MALLFLAAVGVLTFRLVTNLGVLEAIRDPAAPGALILNSGEDEP